MKKLWTARSILKSYIIVAISIPIALLTVVTINGIDLYQTKKQAQQKVLAAQTAQLAQTIQYTLEQSKQHLGQPTNNQPSNLYNNNLTANFDKNCTPQIPLSHHQTTTLNYQDLCHTSQKTPYKLILADTIKPPHQEPMLPIALTTKGNTTISAINISNLTHHIAEAQPLHPPFTLYNKQQKTINTTIAKEHLNQYKLLYTHPIANTTLYIKTGIPKAKPQEQLQTIVTQQLYKFTLLTLLTCTLLYILYKIIIKPVESLSQTVDKLTQGQKVTTVPRGHTQETNNLAKQLIQLIRLINKQKRQQKDLETTQKKYEQAQQYAKEARAVKEEFLSKMRHTLRTPIHSIMGFAEIMAKGKLGNDINQYKEYAKKIQTLGQQLITLSTTTLNRSNISPTNVIQDCITIYKERAFIKDIKLEYQIDNSISDLYADEVRLRQIILGTIHHSMDNTPNNETISITAYTQNETSIDKLSHQYLYIIITDTGFGMDETARESILGKYDSFGISRNCDGSNLSISAIRKLTNLHFGEYTITNNWKKGTQFTVKIPYLSEAEIKELDALQEPDPNTPQTPDTTNITPLFR